MTKRSSLRVIGDGPWAQEIATWIMTDSPTWGAFDFLGCVASSTLESLIVRPSDAFIFGVLDPWEKIRAAAHLRPQGAVFVNALHSSSVISQRARLGQGVVIGPRSVVSCDAIVGDFVTLQAESILGHDSQSGEGCTLSPWVDVTGFVRLGKGVLLGTHTTVSPRVEVGDFVSVEPNSVVIRRVSTGLRVGGIPARTLRVAGP